MSYEAKNTLSKLFAKTMKTMGLDADKIDEEVKNMDEELEKSKVDEKDIDKKDEVKAQDDKDIVPADPYNPDPKGKVDGLAIDKDELKSMCKDMIKDAMEEFKKEQDTAKKGMDEAIRLYQSKVGNNNIAMDSEDAIYSAILSSAGIDSKGISTAEKKGMAKMVEINKKITNDRNIVVGDKNISLNDFSSYITDPETKSILGVK